MRESRCFVSALKCFSSCVNVKKVQSEVCGEMDGGIDVVEERRLTSLKIANSSLGTLSLFVSVHTRS